MSAEDRPHELDEPPRDPAPDPLKEPARPRRGRGRRDGGGGLLAKENRRLILGALVGALVAIFAVLNIDEVDVNWIFGEWETPLILVIAVTFALGALTGWIAGARRRR